MEPVHPEAPLNLFISFSSIHTWIYTFSSFKFNFKRCHLHCILGPAHCAVVWSLSFFHVHLTRSSELFLVLKNQNGIHRSVQDMVESSGRPLKSSKLKWSGVCSIFLLPIRVCYGQCISHSRSAKFIPGQPCNSAPQNPLPSPSYRDTPNTC